MMKYLKIFSIGSKVKVSTIGSSCTILSATIANNNKITYKVAWTVDGDRYSCDIEDVEIKSKIREGNSLTVKAITNNIVQSRSGTSNKTLKEG